MPQANLTDLQEVDVTIPAGNNESAGVTITHNLQDQNGDELTPDSIAFEVGLPTVGAMPDPSSYCFLTARSTPEDGTFAFVMLFSDNNAGVDAVFPVRVISKWEHSIQSRDHSV